MVCQIGGIVKNMVNENQIPYTNAGRLNAELVTRKSFCDDKTGRRCECSTCKAARVARKRQVNRLMGFKFYKGV